jgi:hypothetical protein
MSKVFISRPDGNVSWGFRLQGGLEDNEPLTLINVSGFLFWELFVIFDIDSSIKSDRKIIFVEIDKKLFSENFVRDFFFLKIK